MSLVFADVLAIIRNRRKLTSIPCFCYHGRHMAKFCHFDNLIEKGDEGDMLPEHLMPREWPRRMMRQLQEPSPDPRQ